MTSKKFTYHLYILLTTCMLLIGLPAATPLNAATPRTVVFDFGGVLTGEPKREIVVQFIQQSLQLSQEEFEKAQRQKQKALKHGQTDEEFWLSYAQERGIDLPTSWADSFKNALKEAIAINDQMFVLIGELQERGVTVALLSNIDERHAKLIRELGFYQPFNPCLLSYELDVEKPDPKIYDILLTTLHLAPQEVVFIDDLEENVAAAKEMGIDAIHFLSEEQLRQELIKRNL